MQHHSIEQNQNDQLSEIADKLGKNLTLESSSQLVNCDDDDVVYVINDDDDDEEDDEDGGFEFSFAGEEIKSPLSAEELFHNGQIRPTLPFSVENLVNSEEASEEACLPSVKKVFVVSSSAENDDVAEESYCVWSTEEAPSESQAATPEMRRKSNSTGFSRLWRMKDLLVRSNSDGKDTFVFLPGKGTAVSKEEAEKKKKKMKVVNLARIKVGGKKEGETSSSSSTSINVGGDKEEKKKGKKPSMLAAYEALYGRKKGGGEKSYLPYRVGFFTNANGMTKNVHPY